MNPLCYAVDKTEHVYESKTTFWPEELVIGPYKYRLNNRLTLCIHIQYEFFLDLFSTILYVFIVWMYGLSSEKQAKSFYHLYVLSKTAPAS